MRHVAILVTALCALAPLGVHWGAAGAAGSAAVATTPRPIFGPSVRLLDPVLYPASDAQYAGQPLPADEPSVVVSPDGTVWVAAIHMKYGTALWRGRFGRTVPAFLGMPDHGIGGADVALALGAGALPTLYVASLVPLTEPVAAWRVATTACPAAAVDATFQACIFYPHLAFGRRDRPWLAAYGRSTAYLSYMMRDDNVLSGHMTVRRSDDAGRTWGLAGDPVAALTAAVQGPVHGWPGNLVVDAHTGAVYEAFAVAGAGQRGIDRFNRIVVAVSHDRGMTWADVTAYQGRAAEDIGHMWPGLAVDAAGRLYAAWSDGRGIYLACSSDGGITWARPQRVDTPSPLLRTSLMPWVAAGSAGHVALAWYGTAAASGVAATAQWRVWFAESSDGGHTFSQVAATGTIHRGPVCAKGDECPWLQRQLLDNLGLALDPRTGRAAIVYARSIEFGDYLACRRAANCPQTYYVEEVGRAPQGLRLQSRGVADRQRGLRLAPRQDGPPSRRQAAGT